MHRVEILHTDGQGAEHWASHELPSGWDEVKAPQLAELATVLAMYSDVRVRRLEAFRLLAGVQVATMARLCFDDLLGMRVLEDEDGKKRTLHEVLPQLAWIDEPPCYLHSLLPTLLHGRVPARALRRGRMPGRQREWIGPADVLLNFSVQRWGIADEKLKELQDAGNVEDQETRRQQASAALQELLGALYCPLDLPWTMVACDERGAMLMDLPEPVKLAAVLNYKALRANLPMKYPRCFRGSDAGDGYGVHGMIVDLANTTAFATIERAEQANLHDVLVHCERALARQEEMENRTKTTA